MSEVQSVMSTCEKKYLAAMALVERLSEMLRTEAYVWGGLSIDIHHGQFLREHSDIDYLIVDLHRLADQIQNALRREGWEVKAVLDDHLLIARKEGFKLHLGSIEIGAAVQWRHNGAAGAITFPLSWLRKEAVSFYGVSVHVVEPELGYVLKTYPTIINPAWTIRAKDEPDLNLLKEMLRQKGVDTALLQVQVSSC